MKVGVRLLHKDAKSPSKAHKSDACYDLYSVDEHQLLSNGLLEYDTGVALNIPEGYVGLVFPRSSVTKTRLSLANSVGVIDSGYKNSIKVRFRYHYDEEDSTDIIYQSGDRIAQVMVIPKGLELDVPETDKDDRGLGGFGSSGS